MEVGGDLAGRADEQGLVEAPAPAAGQLVGARGVVGDGADHPGAGLGVHHKSGYVDQDPSNTVSSYTTADVYASYEPIKGLSLLLGVRNVADRDPPFSNQTQLFQGGGWDSRFYDPMGRAYYVRGKYTF